MRKRLRKLFCKHYFVDKMVISEFATISGDLFEVVCAKCGKVKGSYFKLYNEEGNGYR